MSGMLTVVVDKVRHCNAEQRAVQASIQADYALAIHDALGRSQCPRRRLLLLDLRSC